MVWIIPISAAKKNEISNQSCALPFSVDDQIKCLLDYSKLERFFTNTLAGEMKKEYAIQFLLHDFTSFNKSTSRKVSPFNKMKSFIFFFLRIFKAPAVPMGLFSLKHLT